MKIFRLNILIFFIFSPQNIDCGHSLEPPLRGGSNEYPQSMFLSRNKKNNVYPCKPQFYYIKVGLKGVKIIYFRAAQSFFMMMLLYGPDPFSNNSNNSVLPLLQSNLFITTLDITTKFVITIIWLTRNHHWEVAVKQKLCKNTVFNTSRNVFWIFVRIASMRRFSQIYKTCVFFCFFF